MLITKATAEKCLTRSSEKLLDKNEYGSEVVKGLNQKPEPMQKTEGMALQHPQSSMPGRQEAQGKRP